MGSKATKKSDEIKDDIREASALKIYHDSEGGRILIDGLVGDIVDALGTMTANVAQMSHIELVAIVTRVKERLDLVNTLTNAKANVDALKDILAEELKKEAENPPEEDPGP